jgi:hypothetical protein
MKMAEWNQLLFTPWTIRMCRNVFVIIWNKEYLSKSRNHLTSCVDSSANKKCLLKQNGWWESRYTSNTQSMSEMDNFKFLMSSQDYEVNMMFSKFIHAAFAVKTETNGSWSMTFLVIFYQCIYVVWTQSKLWVTIMWIWVWNYMAWVLYLMC